MHAFSPAIWAKDGKVLEIEDFTVRYGSLTAVDGLALGVRTGETVAVLGPNGAGKTSLGRGIMGLTKSSGRVTIDDEDVSKRGVHFRSGRAGLAYVPSTGRVFTNLTVRQNIDVQRGVGRGFWEEFTARFPILAEKAGDRAGSLAGGQQQLLSIARALAPAPRYLILDEPSAGLAPVVVESVFQLLGELPTDSMGVLLLEQNAALALAVADRAIVMIGGRARLEKPTADLRGDPILGQLYLGTAE